MPGWNMLGYVASSRGSYSQSRGIPDRGWLRTVSAAKPAGQWTPSCTPHCGIQPDGPAGASFFLFFLMPRHLFVRAFWDCSLYLVSEVYDVHVQVSFDFFFYDSMLRSTPAARVPAAVILIDIFSRESI